MDTQAGRWTGRFRRASRTCGLLVAVLGVAFLLGWALDASIVKAPLGGMAPVKPNSAVALVLAGLSLVGIGRRGWRGAGAAAAAVAVILLSGASVAESVFSIDFGIDQRLFRDDTGFMPPVAASVFSALGLALLLARTQRALLRLAGGVLSVAGLALSGMVLGACGLWAMGFLDTPIFTSASLCSTLARTLLALGCTFHYFGAMDTGPRSRSRALVLTTTGTIATVSVVVWGVVGWLDYTNTRQDAEVATVNLARVMEEHMRRSLDPADLLLRRLGEQVADRGLDTVAASREEWARLKAIADELPQLENIAIIDANGTLHLLTSSFPPPLDNLAHREYFQAHQAGVEAAIGPLIVAGTTGRHVFTVTRRLTDKSGRFAGVMLASLNTDYFREFYRSLNLVPGSVVAVVSMTGDHMVREPTSEGLGKRNISQDALFRERLPRSAADIYTGRSPVDRVEKLIAYRQSADRKFVTIATIPTRHIYATFERRLLGSSAVLLVVLVVLGSSVYLQLRALASEEAARAQVEASLALAQESEARYRLLAENVPDIITRNALNGVRTFITGAVRRMLGYEPDELVGKETVQVVHPDDRAAPVAAMAALTPESPTATSRMRLRHKDGHYVWAERRVRLVFSPDTGEPVEYAAVISDITERIKAEQALAESEARYRLMADSVSDAIVKVDLNGILTYCSEAGRDLFGCDPAELVGGKVDAIVHADDRGLVMDAFGTLLSGAAASVTETCRVLHKDGHHKDGHLVSVEFTGRLMHDPATGQPTEIVAVVRDVTRRQAMEDELEEARRAAEAANKAKGEFLASLSHELRTPLNAIIGFADLTVRESEGPVDPTYRDFAVTIRDSGQHLLELINEILDHARAEAGQLMLAEDTVDLEAAATFAVRMLAPRAERAGVSLSHSVTPDARFIRGDERRLRQILLNLLSNAVKYTPAGGKVAVTAEVDGDGGGLRIEVADNGIGIAEPDLERVLQAFGRVETAANRRMEGTGLGLPLTRRLVELHGGSLALRSALGSGTTVIVHLPAERVLRPQRCAAGAVDALTRTLAVLLVDDDPLIRMGASALLGNWGHRVIEATNANEALAVLRGTEPIDLLFTDIVMPPGMNGVELAEQAERLRPGIAVLLTSGFAPHAVAGEAGAERGYDLIAKPYSPDELRRRLGQVPLGGRDDAPAPAAPGAAPARAVPHAAPMEAGRSLRILLAEDLAMNQLLAQKVLGGAGHAVDTVADGAAAIAAVQQKVYDLVLMDVNMPGMDGLDATRAIRKLPVPVSRVPILAMTADALPENVEQCLEAGMDGHVAKPLDREALLREVAQWAPGLENA